MIDTQEYQAFLSKLQKRGSKKFRIQHCLGTRDAWKWVRKNKWKLLNGESCSSSLYSSIINHVNKVLIEQLLEGHEIEFPHQMGTLNLVSVPTRVKIVDGKINTNYRTDWKKTLEYWYHNKEARDSHSTIKRVQKNLFYIKYAVEKARYKNKNYYSFSVNRSLKRTLGRMVEEKRINARHINYNIY